MLEITDEEWEHVLKICLRDRNFSHNYNRLHGYLDAIYIYNANADPKKNGFTEPFNLINEEWIKQLTIP